MKNSRYSPSRNGAVVTVLECKSGCKVTAKVSNKTCELVKSAIVDMLQRLADRVKRLTFYNRKEFTAHLTFFVNIIIDASSSTSEGVE